MHFRRWIKYVLLFLIGLTVLVLVAYLLGPRFPLDLTVRFNPAEIGSDPDTYLAARESQWNDIIEGAQKQIVWADPATKARTPYSIIYVHGFSASAGEVRPLPDMIAKNLGANLYFTRLAGHGRKDPDALGDATVNDWINDYAEAMAIGRQIGEKVIVISASTGGSVATWALTQPQLATDTAATIFISPNYGIQASGEFLLTGPWAERLAYAILGPRRGFEPLNEGHAAYWTYDYPTRSVIPMAQAVKIARDAPVESIRVPAYFVISSLDDVVKPELVRDIEGRWGGSAKLDDVGDPGGLSTHVLAGDILNPAATAPMAEKLTDWLKETLSIK